VVAKSRNVVPRRKILYHLDIRGEAGACKYPLEQIVAEERRLGHASVQRRLKGVHVVDALARI
jgi:hypothetical protein